MQQICYRNFCDYPIPLNGACRKQCVCCQNNPTDFHLQRFQQMIIRVGTAPNRVYIGKFKPILRLLYTVFTHAVQSYHGFYFQRIFFSLTITELFTGDKVNAELGSVHTAVWGCRDSGPPLTVLAYLDPLSLETTMELDGSSCYVGYHWSPIFQYGEKNCPSRNLPHTLGINLPYICRDTFFFWLQTYTANCREKPGVWASTRKMRFSVNKIEVMYLVTHNLHAPLGLGDCNWESL